ncbi:hypothetical protein GAY31_17445 [Azospirillum brasilense]|nr:hypothetical protein [Azospirillum brasilense]
MAGRKMVSLPPESWEKVDDFRFGNRIKTESEAIRRLVERGLAYPEMNFIASTAVAMLRTMEFAGSMPPEWKDKSAELLRAWDRIHSEQRMKDWDALDPHIQAEIIREEERQMERLREQEEEYRRKLQGDDE